MKRFLLSVLAMALWCEPASRRNGRRGRSAIIVPFIAGSTPDSLARIVAEGLQQRLGTPFVVENRPGASGNTGTAAAAKAAPDGHTLGVSIVGPLVINALLFAKMPYETEKDIAPITILASQPSVLTSARASPPTASRACSPPSGASPTSSPMARSAGARCRIWPWPRWRSRRA